MILFLDVNKQTISLYDNNGKIDVSFKNAGELVKHTKNNNFLYVTNAVETNAEQVIALIKQMGVSVQEVKPEKVTHIHISNEGVIPIDDELRFRGRYDIHPLTSDLIQKIKETPLLQALIKNGQLEMITSSKRKELEEEKLRKEDEKLGGILVDGTVDEFFDKESKKMPTDVIVVDIDGRGSAIEGGNINTMSELLVEMEGLE